MDFCRSCLVTESLLDNSHFADEEIAGSFFTYSGLTESQRLPMDVNLKLCQNCATQLENVVLFQSICARSNSLLHQYYQRYNRASHSPSPAITDGFLGFSDNEAQKAARYTAMSYRRSHIEPLKDGPTTSEAYKLRRSQRLSRTDEIKEPKTYGRISRPTEKASKIGESTSDTTQLQSSKKRTPHEVPLNDEPTTSKTVKRRRSLRLSRSVEASMGQQSTEERTSSVTLQKRQTSRSGERRTDNSTTEKAQPQRTKKRIPHEVPLNDEPTTAKAFQRRRSLRLSRSEEASMGQQSAEDRTASVAPQKRQSSRSRERRIENSTTEKAQPQRIKKRIPYTVPLKDEPTSPKVSQRRRAQQFSRSLQSIDDVTPSVTPQKHESRRQCRSEERRPMTTEVSTKETDQLRDSKKSTTSEEPFKGGSTTSKASFQRRRAQRFSKSEDAPMDPQSTEERSTFRSGVKRPLATCDSPTETVEPHRSKKIRTYEVPLKDEPTTSGKSYRRRSLRLSRESIEPPNELTPLKDHNNGDFSQRRDYRINSAFQRRRVQRQSHTEDSSSNE